MNITEASGEAEPSEAQLAVDSHGDAIAVWRRSGFVSFNWVIQAAFKPAGGAWQAPVIISELQETRGSGPTRDSFRPQVAFDGQGDAVAVWGHFDGHNDIAQSAFKPAGGSWQAPVNLSSTTENVERPQVAVGAQGDAVAVWETDESNNGTNQIVQGAVMTPGGTWQAPVQLSATTVEAHAYLPRVAVDSQGDAVAAWEQFERVEGEAVRFVRVAYKPAGGAWQPPKTLAAVGSPVSVAMDAGGDALAVWIGPSTSGSGAVVEAALRPAGGAWETPVSLSEPGQPYEPQVQFNPQGDAISVWSRYDRVSADIAQAAVMPAGGTWGPPVSVSQPGVSITSPRVAIDAQRNAIAVWQRVTPTPYRALGASYDAAGPQLNELSIPSNGTAREPISFSVSPLDVWSALGQTKWSFGDGSSATGTDVVHSYAKAGTYQVTVESEDVLGNETTSSGTITIVPRIEKVEYKDWVVSGSLKPRRLNQPITLPEGSTFNGSGELDTETGVSSVTGDLTVPPFTAKFKLFGLLPLSLGVTITEAGALEGTVSETAPGEETLSMQAAVDLRVTSVGLLGLTIPTNCAAAGPIGLPLVDTLTEEELLTRGWSFAGDTTVPPFTCHGGFLGPLFGATLTSLLSGAEAPYAIDIAAPGG